MRVMIDTNIIISAAHKKGTVKNDCSFGVLPVKRTVKN